MQVIIALVIALGVFMITADTFHIPYLRTSMAMDRLARRQKEKTSQVDIWLKGLAVWIAGKLRLNEYRKAQLASDLRSAGIPLTPEMHISNSLVQSLLVGVGAIPFLFFMPFISAVLAGSAVFLSFSFVLYYFLSFFLSLSAGHGDLLPGYAVLSCVNVIRVL